LTAHSRVAMLPPSSAWIAGSAVMTTSASSATMKKATDVRSRLTVGRPRLLVSMTDAFLVRC